VRVLVVNAGSSSLKLSALEGDNAYWSESLGSEQLDPGTVREAVRGAGELDAVGHRIVHGGSEFVDPVRIDQDVVERLEALVELAPLHQPKSLHALETVSAVLPDVPAVACFDTAFHARMPAAASTYALPPEWRKRWDLRRYGFHGLSHAYASRRAAELAGRPLEEMRTITCHLGAGASLAAVGGGISLDTTMGFTPLEGLVMATRSGSVDPGLVLWLEEHAGMPASEIASALEHRSGLLGLAGDADMRAVLAAEEAGDEEAHLAVETYLHRLRAGIASMAAALDGLDAIVFTGGIGERSAPIRARTSAGLSFLGVSLDSAANDAPGLDADVGRPGAAVRVFVVAAREDVEIAREVRRVIRRPTPGRRSERP
jgi:acetate kinase